MLDVDGFKAYVKGTLSTIGTEAFEERARHLEGVLALHQNPGQGRDGSIDEATWLRFRQIVALMRDLHFAVEKPVESSKPLFIAPLWRGPLELAKTESPEREPFQIEGRASIEGLDTDGLLKEEPFVGYIDTMLGPQEDD